MLNRLLNAASAWYVKRGMRSYHHFPADKTAVVFIDVQTGLIPMGTPLSRSLADLAVMARAKEFLVIHAPISSIMQAAYPTPAHREIERMLSSRPGAAEFAPAVTPALSDIVLPHRQSLSIFDQPEVDALIASRGLEHLILAGPLGDLTLDSSLRDAVQRDLHVTVVSDCIAASSPAALELEVRYTMPRYAHLVTELANLKRLAG